VAVVLERVSFAYGECPPVFDGLTVCFASTAVTAVLGPSGCGKSTLLRLVAGLLPSEASHRFSGTVSLGDLPPIGELRARGHIGFVSQESSLLPYLSAGDNIRFPLRILKRESAVDLSALLSAVGLAETQTRYPSELSTGMRLRATLARAFITGPTLLLLDEPFSALDLAWKRALYREFRKIRESWPNTCVMVTHDVIEALLLADQVIVLDVRGDVMRQVQVPSSRPVTFSSCELQEYLGETATLAADLQAAVLAAADNGARA